MQRQIANLLCPVSRWVSLTRALRPSIKVGKEKFQVTLDVRSFNKDEIRVKARSDYVVIEGKQERKMKNGCVIRQFIRRFRLPEGCSPNNMESIISNDGILTVTAKRSLGDKNTPVETNIPVKFAGPEGYEANFIPPTDSKCSNSKKNLCDSIMPKTKKSDNPPSSPKSS